MTRRTLEEYAATVRSRYLHATRERKGQLLDEFCQAAGFHRKAAIRLLNRRVARKPRTRGRPRRYGIDLVPALRQLWEQGDRPCAKLFAAALPLLVDALERHRELRLDPQMRSRILSLSPATIDRLFRPIRDRLGRQPHRRAPSPHALKTLIPTRTSREWKDVAPGSLQGDLVLHCGEHTAGFYLATLTAIDVATGWTELEVVWGIRHVRVCTSIHQLRQRLPFPLREWHVDNGEEFLNRRLFDWCRREGIRMTRGRGHHKNDQAYVEQRNWLAVRRLVGYDRYSSRPAYIVLQRLYALLRLQHNFFRPLRKLIAKERIGSRISKRYDQAQTPYQRILASNILPDTQLRALERQYLDLNPAALNRDIQQTLEKLWPLREK